MTGARPPAAHGRAERTGYTPVRAANGRPTGARVGRRAGPFLDHPPRFPVSPLK